MSEGNEKMESLSSDNDDKSNDSSSEKSKGSEEELGGLELFNSEDFDPNDYDDYDLSIIYHNTILDLFEQMKEFKEIYEEKLKNYQEMLRHSTQNETKLKQYVAQAQEIIKELKEGYDKNSKSFSEITEAYQNEQIAHNKTLQELSELRIAQKGMCANMTMCAAVEIVVQNGKITSLNMKESLDSARDDALAQLNLMTRKVDELRRELNGTKVEVTKNNEELEKEKKNSQELLRQIELMKTESLNLQNDVKLKNNEIEELKKKIEEEAERLKKTVINREEKMRAIIERNKRLGTNRQPTRNRLLSRIPGEQNGTGSTLLQPIVGNTDTLLTPKQGSAPKINIQSKQNLEVDPLTNALSTTAIGLFSKPPNSNINPLTAVNIEEMSTPRTNPTPRNSLLAQSDTKSKIFRRKKSSSKSLINNDSPIGGDVILSGKDITNVGMIEDGIVIVNAPQAGNGEVSLLKHKTFVPEFNLDIDVKRSTQTKYGFCVADENSIVVLSRVNKTIQIEGITNIGESKNGVLVVNNHSQLIEIIDGNTKIIDTLPCKVDGNVYMVDRLVIFKDEEDKLVTYLPTLKNICYSETFVKQVIVANDLIYAIDRENDNKIYIYDVNLSMKSNKLIPTEIESLVSFGDFVLAICSNSVYCVNQKTIKPLFNPSSETTITAATFSADEKKIYAIVLLSDKVMKVPTDLHVHEIKEHKDSKGTSKCDNCGKSVKKGKKCKKCGICCDSDCTKSYHWHVVTSFNPCLE